MSAPDLEIVDIQAGQSFKAWSHGYPFRTVRWHFHPEYEIHLVTATEGRAFVGDHIGRFGPGNLVMTGPDLPHNWLTDVPPGTTVPERCIVLQFSAGFAGNCIRTFDELSALPALLGDARRGIQFTAEAAAASEPIMRALLTATGTARLAAFFELLDILLRSEGRRLLASPGYHPSPDTYMRQPLNHVLDHIERNLDGELRESEMAELSGYSPSAFSRAFRRHTGTTFVRHVNGMRIGRACALLIGSEQRITDICHDVGFNNLANFNRQFLAHKAMPPRAFRSHHRACGNSGRDGAAKTTLNPQRSNP